MAQVNEELAKFKSGVASDFQQMAAMVGRVFKNQSTLASSHDRFDAQQAVMLRMFITRINELTELHNRTFVLAAQTLPEDERPEGWEKALLPVISPKDVDACFGLFQKFKERPDYAEHFTTWYMGGDLDELPSVVEREESVDELKMSASEAEEPSSPYPDGVQIFGGDYVSPNRNGTEESEPGSAEEETAAKDPVSELQGGEDSGEDSSRVDSEGEVVPEVRA